MPLSNRNHISMYILRQKIFHAYELAILFSLQIHCYLHTDLTAASMESRIKVTIRKKSTSQKS